MLTSIIVAIGPASTRVMSTTLMPASGLSFTPVVATEVIHRRQVVAAVRYLVINIAGCCMQPEVDEL